MRMYVGSTRKRSFVTALRKSDVGRVNHPKSIFTPYAGEKWFADNGAFSHWLRGETFDDDGFLRYLDRLQRYREPQFAVLPDIVADGLRSLDYSLDWLSRGVLPRWRWYLALQDGMSYNDVYACAELVDGLFIGGTIRFKSQAYMWCRLGEQAGIPVHYGRAGIHARIHDAHVVGCASADSAFPLWTQERMARFLAWMKNGHYDQGTYRQLFLPLSREV